MNKIFLELEGKTNDLLMVNDSNTMKRTRLIKLDPTSNEINEEIVDLAITSTNMSGEHPLFDEILDKRIRIKVEVLD